MLAYLLFLLRVSCSVEINLIPSLGPSPPLIGLSKVVYDEMTSSLITIGGFNIETSGPIIDIYSFSLLNNTWEEITPESEYIPEPFQQHYLYITKSRLILVLFPVTTKGLLSDIFAFDLNTFKWDKKTLTGDTILSRRQSLLCSFSHNNTNYIAVYGGFDKYGYDESLYLINAEKLISYKLPNNGFVSPGIKDSASLIYYEGKLILYGISNILNDFFSDENLFLYDLAGYEWVRVISEEGSFNVTTFHMAKIQGKSMFVYFGIDANGLVNIVRKLDLESYEWEIVGEVEGRYFLGYSACEVGDMLYFMNAYYDKGPYEPILLIDVADHPNEMVAIAPRLIWPRKRQGHCMTTVNNKIVIIGGLAEDSSTYLDDVWQLDADTVAWTELSLTGDTFEGRAFMNCHVISGVIFVIGGKSNTQVYSDTFFLNLKSFSWAKIKPISSINSENYGACSVNGNFIYITFGLSSQQFLDTIFIYNFIDNTLKVSYLNKGPKIRLASHNCWIETKRDYDNIFIVNGENPNGTPNRNLYKVTIYANNSEKYDSEIITESDELARFESALVKTENYVFLIFGMMKNAFLSDSIAYINLKNYDVGSIHNIGIYAYSHAACHLRDKIYLFGGGGTHGRSSKSSATSKLFRIVNTLNDPFTIGCGPGTIEPECKPCEQGYYYDENFKSCVACIPGTYSTDLGAVSLLSCTLCSENSYSDTYGSKYCKECPLSSHCPIGSSSLNLSFSTYSEVLKSSQPSSYKPNNFLIYQINDIAIFIFIGLSFFLLILLIFIKFIRKNLKKLDLYSSNHNTLENNPIIVRKTLLGGFFSCMFFIAAYFLVLIEILSYFKDNIVENKTLIPLVIEDRPIYSDYFIVKVELSMFGGSCVSSKNDGSMKMFIKETNVNFIEKKYRAVPENDNKKCVIEMLYRNFSIHYEAYIALEVRDFIAYARMISVNIETNSSIPKESSIIEQSIVPNNDNEVFNGNSYSEFFIKVTPSLFESESNSWPSISQGFHISQSQIPTKGSAANEKGLSIADGIYIKINLSQSDNLLYTKRELKNTLFVVFSGLAGAVFGIMGSFGSLMSFTESNLVFITNKYTSFKKIRSIINLRKRLKLLFNDSQNDICEKHDPCNTTYEFVPSVKFMKIVPITDFVNNLDEF